MKTVNYIYFSPTDTSRKIARAIAGAISSSTVANNITYKNSIKPIIPGNEVAIITTPVYAGAIPAVAVERLKKMSGHNTPAILVVVYGNRDFEGALLQLNNLAIELGFLPIAAAAFIGEHSYSTPEKPIAENRPDDKDIEMAVAFGKEVSRKLDKLSGKKLDATTVSHPSKKLNYFGFVLGVLKLKIQKPVVSRIPLTDKKLCNNCGICVSKCPVQAITKEKPTFTDKTKCIRCCACVKSCPQKARKFETPFGNLLHKWMNRRNKPTWRTVD